MGMVEWWKPDIMFTVFSFLDLPTQVRVALVSKSFVPAEAVGASVAAAEKLIQRLQVPTLYLQRVTAQDARTLMLPSQAFLYSARIIWRLVAAPLMALSGRTLECPGLLGEVRAEVYVLGYRGRRQILSEQWWRRLIGRWDEPARPWLLRIILRERNMNENSLEAVKDLNYPDPHVDEAMAILQEGSWSFHWFPVRFDDEADELVQASAVIEFEIHGVCGILWLHELWESDL